jgi:hypothetical protein
MRVQVGHLDCGNPQIEVTVCGLSSAALPVLLAKSSGREALSRSDKGVL